jgi:hypothetical protein
VAEREADMAIGLLVGWVAAQAGPLDVGPSHTFGLRYRRGSVPNAILNGFYYDTGDEGVLYDRPDVRANVFGLEYTLGLTESATFVFWAERISFPIEGGYWDDEEKDPDPPDHVDGDWVEFDGVGAWVIGANYAYDVPLLRPPAAPIDLFLALGGGIGLGPASGKTLVWHPGYRVEDNADPTCGPDDLAPERRNACPVDDELNLPGVFPVVDLTISPKLTIADRVMVRIDLGLHTVPYWGVAAGGML